MTKKLYTFDFDGTLTTKDTLLQFIRYASGTWLFIVGFLLHSPLLVLMKLKLYPNYRAKQRVFAWFFRGMELKKFDAMCQQFAKDNATLLRPKAQALLTQLFAQGESVCVVSASIDNWVRPFFTELTKESCSPFCVLGTQVETDACGRLTGRFLTPNCYGEEKVRRLCLQYPDLKAHRDSYYIEAFGDSKGDEMLFAYADNVHYKPFR